MFVKTRIAPTPSGYLHLGNILSMLITTSLAQHHQAKVLLRIDDLDHLRTKKKFVKDIFDTLNFLEIPWDEGPADYKEFIEKWSQHKRLPLYKKAIEELVEKGKLFACNCSRRSISRSSTDLAYPGLCRNKKLNFKEGETSLRIKLNAGEEVKIKNWDKASSTIKLPTIHQDFVVQKKDGYPSYQLTSLVDDMFFGIDAIVRGKDLQASTAAQLLLAEKMGMKQFSDVVFLHHPLLLSNQKVKLSKSDEDTSIHQMRKQGMDKESIYLKISQILNLPVQVKSYAEFVEVFDLTHLPKTNMILG